MPRPTRTRRVRGAPLAEAPRPSPAEPSAPAEPENPTAVSSRLGSISSDIYSATPPPAAEASKRPAPAPAPTTRRATRSSTGAAPLPQNAPASEDVSMMSVATQRPDPPSARRGRTSRRDTSGIDIDMHDDAGFDGLDSDLDMDLDLEMNDTAELDDGGAATAATPASANTSVISVSQFKRRGRSRKPSFTGSDSGQHIRPSSRGPGSATASTTGFNIGLFRRRAREPSIIGANRRRRAGSVATSNSDVGTDVERDNNDNNAIDDDDLDIDMADFQPDAISTPYKKRRSLGQKEPESASRDARNLRKRKTSDVHEDTPKQAEKQARRESERYTRREAESQPDEVEVPASIPPPSSAAAAAVAVEVEVPASIPPPIASIEDDNDDNLSDISSVDDADSLPSPLSARLIRPAERPTTPDRTHDEAALAPPMSGSSSDADTGAWPSIRDVARRRRAAAPTTPIRARDAGAAAAGGSSPLSSPPSLTHSPNYAHAKAAGKARARAAARPAPAKVMTAELQSLLPQRRTRAQQQPDVYDVEESEDAGRTARRPGGSQPASRGRAEVAPAMTLAQRKKTQFEPSRRISRTYGARSAPEQDGEQQQENGLAPDDSFQPLVDEDTLVPQENGQASSSTPEDGSGAAKGNTRELKQAVKKFKEVDKWQMDFEEVTEPSSPPGAR